MLPVLARSPSKAARIGAWRLKPERDVAAACLALRIRESAPSTRRFSCRSAESPLLWRARHRKRRVLGACGLKPSVTRRRTASHCVFALKRPQLGDSPCFTVETPCCGALSVEATNRPHQTSSPCGTPRPEHTSRSTTPQDPTPLHGPSRQCVTFL